jgi:cytochrome c biogenesis protein CcmG, thiol:disulfide interchange protein DsbE
VSEPVAESAPESTDGRVIRNRPLRLALALLPLLALVGLIALFAASINRDPSLVQSVLIDKPAPQFSLPPVSGLKVPGFDTARLKGQVTIVNVFASWCIPCRDEHPVLAALRQQTGVPLFGINQKDAPENAAAFLSALGNPYDAIGADADGRTSIDWGVYGVPETFIVDARGVIRFKHTGPLSLADIDREIVPALARAKAAG